MIISQLFVEFIFFSFLGWVWESIYCTAKEKKWADRGFLFGPICPIYGTCVCIVIILFKILKYYGVVSNTTDMPIWAVFLISMIGSAIAEYLTSWVLEKRFNARWWDYSKVPLNINGRIALPISIAFGLAGIVVIRYVVPWITGLETSTIHPLVYEGLALGFGILFGADFALTEASLNALLKTVEDYKQEFNEKAELTYERIASTPERIQELPEKIQAMPSKIQEAGAEKLQSGAEKLQASAEKIQAVPEKISESISEKKEQIAESRAQRAEEKEDVERKYMLRLTRAQRLSFHGIQKFMPERESKHLRFFPELKMDRILGRAKDEERQETAAERLKKYLDSHRKAG